jgi:hypothetical protein
MRHKKVGLGLALLVLLLSAVLGATVLREPIAYAASPFQSVLVANTADSPVPVAQQGTANVNVTNETLSVAQPPVTGGGGQRIVAVTINEPPFPAQTASAMTVGFQGGASLAILSYQGAIVAWVIGSVASATGGPETVPVNLTRPLKFDSIDCGGAGGPPQTTRCLVTWVGAQP